ncbi:gamma-glutamylcyclotransferase family protein YtfP [Desulfosporosinus acididurans]|uniref:Gamma-glutamylcyclotransferase family protein YtfP n=1 Tax=Desulfosporosinus acididurans TaxID=476652 RepID=A0A0J1IIA6_9FIRM|nr:gamma-glutamylcyclotransferase family protein [Desulfosporosinus acididurans]KLU64436.1 gamma-glutamylcyclotransferase family protein YtfP [Desulfosporosinus acididurans]
MLKYFKRPEESKVNDYKDILESYKSEMMKTLDEISQGKGNLVETQKLIKSLIMEQDEKGFWGLIPSPEVDGDIRVDYWYEPTYIATAIMMKFFLKNKEEAEKIEGFGKSLKKGLEASTGRYLKGHGHDEIRGILDALNIFSKSMVLEFVDRYPDFSPEFKVMIDKAHKWLNDSLVKGNTRGDWGEDYKEDMYKTVNALGSFSQEDIKVMVYGTLMKGGSNFKRYMSNAEYLGRCTAVDFALYDLGSFPGAVYSKGDRIKGELYRINRDTLRNIDRLEGEGSLYLRLYAYTEGESGKTEPAYIYVYNHDVYGSNKVSLDDQPWGKPKDSALVWYACYGSNINKDRFMKYINGDETSGNPNKRKGCQDKTPPMDEKPMLIEHPIYFANESSQWDNKGVAFLDTSRRGRCFGKKYLITWEQFERIHELEGKGDSWYNETIELGSEDGIPIKTITHSPRDHKYNLPGTAYIEVIKKGLKDTYPEMTEVEIDAYLIGRFLKKEEIMILDFLRSQEHGVTIHKIAGGLKMDMNSTVNSIFNLKEAGLIRQDGRSVRTGASWDAASAIYYTVLEKREAIDRLVHIR